MSEATAITGPMLYKPVGMSIDESLKSDIEVANKLRAAFPELTRIFTRIGTSDIATDPMPPNGLIVLPVLCVIFVREDDDKKPVRQVGADKPALAEAIAQ